MNLNIFYKNKKFILRLHFVHQVLQLPIVIDGVNLQKYPNLLKFIKTCQNEPDSTILLKITDADNSLDGHYTLLFLIDNNIVERTFKGDTDIQAKAIDELCINAICKLPKFVKIRDFNNNNNYTTYTSDFGCYNMYSIIQVSEKILSFLYKIKSFTEITL